MSADLIVAISSLAVALISFFVARKTLIDAEEFWKQQKWFDLYTKADQAYNDLDNYQVQNHGVSGIMSMQQGVDYNALMNTIRGVHTLAMVFPKCQTIDELVKATSVFSTPIEALNPAYLKAFMDALEGLRQMPLLDPSILTRRKLGKPTAPSLK